jgi:hypothetical protein
MSNASKGPHCPECGEPIGQTATYCMHCSTDLTDERAAADADEDGVWDGTETGRNDTAADGATTSADGSETATAEGRATGTTRGEDGPLLAPDGLLDDTLTVVVGIAGGIVVGIVGTIVLFVVTGSALAFVFGFVTWLGATAYLVRRRTVQGAVAKSGYAVAVVLLAVPVIALSPVVPVDGGLGERGELFVTLLVIAGIPAAIAAGVGWVASRFVPADAGGGEG